MNRRHVVMRRVSVFDTFVVDYHPIEARLRSRLVGTALARKIVILTDVLRVLRHYTQLSVNDKVVYNHVKIMMLGSDSDDDQVESPGSRTMCFGMNV